MRTSLQRSTRVRSAAWALALVGSAACQIIAGVDRSEIGATGVGGAGDFDGAALGVGGSSGSDQDADTTADGSLDDMSVTGTGAGGAGTAGTGGASGAGGAGGTVGTGGAGGT